MAAGIFCSGVPMAISKNHIVLSSATWPLRVWVFCFLSALALVLLDAFLNYGKVLDSAPLRRIFNITREDGLATWFMVVQTFCVGSLLVCITLLHRSNHESALRISAWGMLSIFFLYMSADDGAEIHERLGSTFKAAAKEAQSGVGGVFTQAQGCFPSYDWQLVVLPFFAVAGLLMIVFLLREFGDIRSRFLLFIAPTLMACAVSLDFFEGLDEAHPLNVHTWLQQKYDLRQYTVSHFAKSLEEFLEMIAMATFLVLFLLYLLRLISPTLTIESRNED